MFKTCGTKGYGLDPGSAEIMVELDDLKGP